MYVEQNRNDFTKNKNNVFSGNLFAPLQKKKTRCKSDKNLDKHCFSQLFGFFYRTFYTIVCLLICKLGLGTFMKIQCFMKLYPLFQIFFLKKR